MSVILKRGIYGMFALAFFFYGLRYTSLSEAQVLVMTSPFLTGIFSSIKLNENYTKT
jgi:drug/metabolite transporter (DMT)-like permease